MMDIEPGRCRRTDGKKWRCHQSVVPNEKYCEKHMHRGSKRSRKLVEASIYTVVKGDENEKPKNQSQRELDAKDRTAVMNLASELVFSPKTVLHNGMGYPKSETLKTTSESESRCHKIDGNIWLCKKEIVPDYKFCAQHHSRRKIYTKKPSPSPSASRGVRVSYACTPSSKSSRMQEGEVGLCLAVGSNMKVSLPSMMADPKNVIKDNVGVVPDGVSSFSSEATETDEEISGVWDVVSLSP